MSISNMFIFYNNLNNSYYLNRELSITKFKANLQSVDTKYKISK